MATGVSVAMPRVTNACVSSDKCVTPIKITFVPEPRAIWSKSRELSSLPSPS